LRPISTARPIVPIFLVLLAFAATGCGGGSHPSGTAAALATAGEDVFAFDADDSLTALAVSPAAPGRVFAFQQGGVVKILNVDASPVALENAVVIGAFDGQFGFPTAASALAIDAAPVGGKLAGFATSTGDTFAGASAQKVYLFDTAVTGTAAVFDLRTLAITASGLTTSTGTASPTFSPTDANAQALAIVGDRLFVGTSNLLSSQNPALSFLDNFPGTVIAFDLDPADHTRFAAASPTAVVFTLGYNVTGLVAAKTPGGADVVYVTTSGAGESVQGSPAGATDAHVEVLDPRALAIRGDFPLGPSSARGPLAVRPDGLEGAVGRGDFAFGQSEIFRLSLLDVDLALGGSTVRDLSGDIENGPGNPIVIPFADPAHPQNFRFVSGLSYDRAGARLFAVNFNDSTVSIFAAARGATPTFRELLQLKHGATSINAQSPHADLLVVREGTPGHDFQGFDVFVGSVGIPTTGAAGPSTRGALDGVKTY
jgi:hypothetical protein